MILSCINRAGMACIYILEPDWLILYDAITLISHVLILMQIFHWYELMFSTVSSFFTQCHNADQLYVWLLHFIANNYLIFSHKPDFLELSGELSETVWKAEQIITTNKVSLCLKDQMP